MRSDMAKVLIEGARTQSDARSRKWGVRLKHDPESDYEDQPKFASSARHRQYGHDCKSSTDVLGPLRGYLESKVGQPWDAVYSEICENMDKRSTVGAHIFTHLWQFVERDCWIGAETGKVYTGADRQVYGDYYVHPHTGLLCKAPRRARWKMPRTGPATEIMIGDGESYRLIDGIWYWTRWSKVKLARWEYSWSRGEDVVIFEKRQLGKKELRDLKLRNAPMMEKRPLVQKAR